MASSIEEINFKFYFILIVLNLNLNSHLRPVAVVMDSPALPRRSAPGTKTLLACLRSLAPAGGSGIQQGSVFAERLSERVNICKHFLGTIRK